MQTDRPRRRHGHDRRAADRPLRRLRQAPRHRRGHLPQADADDDERAKVNHLMARGAQLAVDDGPAVADFEALGHKVSYDAGGGPGAGDGGHRLHPGGQREQEESTRSSRARGASSPRAASTGSASRTPWGINDEALVPGEDRFIQIVSCNTHNIAVLIKTLAVDETARAPAERAASSACGARTTSPRTRASLPAPTVGKHDDPEFGTHHARDAYHLFDTLGWKPPIFSSAMKLNTQYMHSLWFDMDLTDPSPRRGGGRRCAANPRIALTEKRSANQIFSFGRDHGYYGRILSQTVVAAPDGDGARRPRGHRLLLHAAGRQLARLVDRGGALDHRAGLRPREALGPGPLLLPGDLRVSKP